VQLPPTEPATDTPAGPEPEPEPEPAAGRVYGGLSPQQRREGRRRRLLDAALELFAAQGYAATSIERVCSTAGVTTRTLYEEFASREGLLAALFDETSALAIRAVEAALADAPAGFQARVEAALDAFIRTVLADPRRARIEYLQVGGISPELERHRLSVMTALVDLTRQELETAAAAGLVAQRAHHWTAVGAVGAANQMIYEWVREGIDEPIDVLIAEVSRVFTATIAG